MDFWSGALGFFLGLAANKTSERWTLYRAHRDARRLAGEWVAHNYKPEDDRFIDPQPMPHAGLTVISAKSWWSTNSHVLDVHAQDIESNGQVKDHNGFLAIDPMCPWRAIRTIRYVGSDLITEQRIEISGDGDVLYVFDKSADGRYSKKHALRRVSPASLILSPMASVTPLETQEESAILYARRCYALAFFALSCLWLLIVTVLLYLNGFSVAHVSDPVLIAAITTIPVNILAALFVVFRYLFPSAPTRRS